jgi:glycosyltransferase involved in cell wall biosynthesis
LVEDGQEGFLVPPADPEALASKISELLRDPKLCAALGAKGQAKVAREYSLEKMIQGYEALYDRYLHTP